MPNQYSPGPEGEQGERGKQGKSAYQVARGAGFRGTEAQWLLSLKGRPGDSIKGDKGDKGDTGLRGASAAPPELPTRAEFERDSATDLTERVLVYFPSGVMQITPIREGGLMMAADFQQLDNL